MKKTYILSIIAGVLIIGLGIGIYFIASNHATVEEGENPPTNEVKEEEGEDVPKDDPVVQPPSETPVEPDEETVEEPAIPTLEETITEKDGKMIVTNPDDITVLVNKTRSLPSDYVPTDLVEPNVTFSFSEKIPKRLMRAEAAKALELLFQKAKEDGIELVAQSGFRSYETQEALFASYSKTHGEEQANKFSAYPGQSEHQTGLAMDITSAELNFMLEEEFGETDEGKWLSEHCAEFGFVIRYLKGKEDITGYIYEPWHVRYVGVELAKAVMDEGITLEEYFQK